MYKKNHYTAMAAPRFYHFSDAEIREAYSKADKFAKTFLRSADAQQLSVAPFDKCTRGQTHLIVPIYGGTKLDHTYQLYKELKKTFGVDHENKPAWILNEREHDGTGFVQKLNIPICRLYDESDDYDGNERNFRNNTKRFSNSKNAAIPTLEWPLLLTAVEILLCGYAYYRHATGILI
ncbi:MAG: hypothetical protein K2Q45_03265 [Nitrosomonas sp.]|nr:hypothetical protein [Nitrosomonas sp.]